LGVGTAAMIRPFWAIPTAEIQACPRGRSGSRKCGARRASCLSWGPAPAWAALAPINRHCPKQERTSRKLQVMGGELGFYNPLTKSINLSSAINWVDPNNTAAIINGQPGIYQALAGEAAYINVPTLTAGQFMDLVILHELSHYNGSIGNPDRGPGVEQRLYKDCIK